MIRRSWNQKEDWWEQQRGFRLIERTRGERREDRAAPQEEEKVTELIPNIGALGSGRSLLQTEQAECNANTLATVSRLISLSGIQESDV